MTIEAWVLIDNYQDYGAVITKGTTLYSEVAPFSLMQGYGGHMRLSYNFNGSPSGNFFTNSVIPLDVWTHSSWFNQMEQDTFILTDLDAL